MHLIAPEVGLVGTVPIVSGTIPIAVGAALASRIRGESKLSVAFFGDGAMEEGTAHESLNLAGHRKLPVIFVCENNVYASHLSLLERRAKDNIPAIADAHGVTGIRVNGNDVVAVFEATAEAAERARGGLGPTLIECRTYRWRGHVGPSMDMDVGVKRKDELAAWFLKDPIAGLRQTLLNKGISTEEIDLLSRQVQAEVESSIEFARRAPFPQAEELLQHVFHDKGESDL